MSSQRRPTLLLLARHSLLFIGGFGTMQSIIVASSTRPEIRGRVLGVSIGSGPIGALNVNWIATERCTETAVLAITSFILTVVYVLGSRKNLRRIPRYRQS